MTHARPQGSKRRHASDRANVAIVRHRGVVLVITLLGIIFLASLVFYVLNIGAGVRSRVRSQHAADAVVHAGAGWKARAMNTVAMNNVGIARQIGLVNVLDAMPKTVNFTLTDQEAMLEAVETQLRRGTGPDPWVWPKLLEVEAELQQQVQWLREVDTFFNESGFDVRNVTHYNAPDGDRGRLWQAMTTLDELSRATIAEGNAIAQVAAVRAAEVNQAHDEAAGMLVPAGPQIPTRRGRFNDFRPAVIEGLTPRAKDMAQRSEWTEYRGPFDAIFGWRDILEDRQYGPPSGSTVDDGFDSSWSGGTQQSRSLISSEPVAYRTFGTHAWMVRRFHGLNYIPPGVSNGNVLGSEGELRYSGFRLHLHEISDIKLGYLWPGTETQEVIEPRWLTDYTEARAAAEAGSPEIHGYRFIELEFTQEFTYEGYEGPVESAGWSIRTRPSHTPPNINRQTRYIWRDTQVEDVLPNRDIDGDDEVENIKRREMHYYIFGGANVGDDVAVINPHQGVNPGDDELPAPIQLDHDLMTMDEQTRWQRLTFLGVAQQPRRARMWPEAFDKQRPSEYQTAVAQARVFNNHSWDLWTAMWHVQLEPVQRYEQWLPRVDAAAVEAATLPILDSEAVDRMRTHVKAARDLAPVMLKH